MKHIVVFDGTSFYVIPESEVEQEIENNDVEVIDSFTDIDDAFSYCETENIKCCGF